MMKKSFRLSCFVAIAVISLLIVSAVLPIALANNVDNVKGFDKGPSYISVVPMKRVTFVNFDENSFLDDYAYLAAVPTTVFNDGSKLFSNPLLFYQDEYPVKEDKELSLNARQGLDYFMEDWMDYCNAQLDKMTLINVPKDKLDSSWKAKDYATIESDNPYDTAGKIALDEWSYSDNAVVAVVDENFEKPNYVLNSKVEGRISGDKKIIGETFFSPQLNKLNPRFHEFVVPEGYKYLKSRTWWASLEVGKGSESALPIGIKAVIPAADPDSQLFCKYNGEWMETAMTQGWNIEGMDEERTETYVYNSGPWRLGITDVPTKALGGRVTTYGRLIDILRNMVKGATYQTDITIFPGAEVKILDNPCFGCRDATFKLTWDNPSIHLGFSVIGPSGEEILSASGEDVDFQEIHLDQFGERLPGESYSVSVFTLNDLSGPIDFKVEYNWRQNFSRAEADSLVSATEGAVLASVLNAPLLYTSSSGFSDTAKDVFYKLGVSNIYLVDLGNHLKGDVEKEISNIVSIKEHYREPEQIYSAIMDLTDKNDIIFSTIDPWTPWSVPDMKPGDETAAALFIGPAAYIAAQHGSPVLIIDIHPELSSAVVWHNEFWKQHPFGFPSPTVAKMYLTGKRVYDFLGKCGFDKEGVETMITVADQYEVGATWDRTFVGKAKPGRFFGSPVDVAYWISRSVFYPALIYVNPALNPDGVSLIQGSESVRRNVFPWGQVGLKIVRPSQEEVSKYPILQTYVSYEYRLNEQFKKYYGFQYKSADDIVPGVTESFNMIDEGMVPGKEGAIWPDLSPSEVIPSYLDKGGYSNVFSTSNSTFTSDLNKGVILWLLGTHGTGGGSGYVATWGPKESAFKFLPSILEKRFGFTKESNPWRGYEWYLGSTENPDTMTMEVHGFLPAFLGNPNLRGLLPTGQDFWPSERPLVNALAKIPIIKWFMPVGWRDNTLYKDGMVNSHTFSCGALGGISGLTLDDMLDNIHSCGWINTACLPAYKYMHLTMVRHGSVFQVIDPWLTSWYGAFWQQSIPRDIILGDTVGEAYTKGISHVGILYITDPPQWWWDREENVCFFGDPDLRMFVPGTDYSDANHWEKEDTTPLRYDAELSVAGHMPFGVTSYPNEKTPVTFWQQYLWLIVALTLIVILAIAAITLGRKKK